jgi:hypothetical protein
MNLQYMSATLQIRRAPSADGTAWRSTMSKSLKVGLGEARKFLGDGLNFLSAAFSGLSPPTAHSGKKTRNDRGSEQGRRVFTRPLKG